LALAFADSPTEHRDEHDDNDTRLLELHVYVHVHVRLSPGEADGCVCGYVQEDVTSA
jgi:hypothetical protein